MAKLIKVVISIFTRRYDNKIIGTISTFDRMIFKGHLLPFFAKSSRDYFFWKEKILIKNFKAYANKLSTLIKDHAKEMATRQGRPFLYLNSSRESKENLAKEILERDKIEEGLICVLSCVEPCLSFDVRFNKENNKLEIVNRDRKCMFIYFYYQDKEFGFMHVRLQTWFSFQMQIYINGRHWLMKQLDKKGIDYKRYENSIIEVGDIKKAQKIAEGIVNVKFAKIFDAISKELNPVLPRIKKIFSNGYYWVLDQGEYATDVMFKNRETLTGIYPELVEHALLNFNATDVMSFLGRKLNGNFQGEVTTDTKRRPQGVRIKHRMKKNSIKMYDKWSILRIETTINNPREFKIYREVERHGEKVMRWVPMGKSVFNLYRYAAVCKAANERYLDALSSFKPLKACIKELEHCTEPIQIGSYRCSGFNPISSETTKLFEAVLDGSNIVNGFRNKDIRCHLFGNAKTAEEKRKQSSKITREIRKLRTHKLIAKVPRSSKYKVSEKGYRIMGACLKLKNKYLPSEMSKAA